MMPVIRRFVAAGMLAAVVGLSGCATSVADWIVDTRDRQGDLALASGSFGDASVAYLLALKVHPHDERARAGIVRVQIALAEENFINSKFEEALAALAVAQKYDPQNVRIANVRQEVEGARLQQQIVLSNYPSYAETIAQLRRDYDSLRLLDAVVLTDLKEFNYTFDSNRLHAAIRSSYELNRQVTLYTNRLQSFRQLVESGTPAAAAEKGAPSGPSSLLPLP